MEIILIGTQEYNWCLPIFAELFNKYWGEPVLYIGDTPPGKLPHNITFQKVPVYQQGVWPWRWWFGNGLRAICQQFKNEIIALFLLDHWLNRPVNRVGIAQLAEYMQQNKKVIRGNLTDTGGWDEAEIIDHYKGLDILYIPPWDIHHSFLGGMTFCPSLWNTNLLDQMIEPAWTLWECEELGTRRMKEKPHIKAVGTRPALLGRTHGLYHNDPKRVSVGGLNEDDRQIVKQYLPANYNLTDL